MPFNFEKLEVYNKAIVFSNEIYSITKKFPKEEIFGVVSQLRRAAVSVSLNIAEGSGRTKSEFRHFLTMARSSVLECIPLLEVSLSQNYICNDEKSRFYSDCEELSKMLCGLIKSL